jgi:predicted ester cyclase
MSKESAQAALGKFAEGVNTGNYDLFDQVVDPNCVDHDPADGQVPGPTGYRMFFSGMRAAFPDMAVAPETVVQDEDTIAFAYTLTGTHTGPLGKIPPTSKKVKIRGMQISKFKDGKMVERWGSSDELTLLKQIGVIPA